MAEEFGPNPFILPDDETALSLVGGTSRMTGGELMTDFGWRASLPEDLAGPAFAEHDPNENVPIKLNFPIIDLTAPARSAYRGPIPYNWQLTGSCVQGGFFNALVNRIGMEIAHGGQAESFELPFTLYNYGQSRWMAYRDRSPGEGSSGGAIVQAAELKGIPSWLDPDAPKPSILHSIDKRHLIHVYTRAQELQFSGISGHPAAMEARSRPVKLKYIRCRTAESAFTEMQRGRPLTFAGTWGGLNRPPVAGGNKGPKVLLNRHASSWSHQQSCSIVWDHPDLKRLWNINNQWFGPGPDSTARYIRVGRSQMIAEITVANSVVSVHGDPVDPYSPLGSYWVPDKDMEWQCRNGEVFAIELIGGYGGEVGPIGI